MIRRRNRLRWATGLAAGAVAAIVTYYATLAGHDGAGGDVVGGSAWLPGEDDLDVGEWDVRWIR